MIATISAIGAMESTAAVRLPGLLSEYHRRHPGVVLELRTGNPQVLGGAILAGELDAALVAEPIAGVPFVPRAGWPRRRSYEVTVTSVP